MRIGIFSPDFPYKPPFDNDSYIWGGVGEVVYNLSMELGRRGHSVTVLSVSHGEHIEQTHNNIRVIRFKKSGKVQDTYVSIKYLFGHLSENFDVVHMHRGVPSGAIGGHIHSMINSTPSVISVHGDLMYSPEFSDLSIKNTEKLVKYVFLKGFNIYARKILSDADVITTVSEGTRTNAKFLRGFREDTLVIPNGVNPPNEVSNESSDTADNIILYLGSLTERKNPHLLIEALNKMSKSENILLYIAGDGHLREDLEERASDLELDDNIEFMGFVNEEMKGRLYEKSDVFVHPSSRESFGITVLEANSYGVPVVAGDVRGIRELVTDGYNGLISSLDADSIAKALHRVLEQNQLKSKLERNALTFARDYSWESITNRYINAYKQAIKKR